MIPGRRETKRAGCEFFAANRVANFRDSRRRELQPNLRMILPFPAGEGRSEGEQLNSSPASIFPTRYRAQPVLSISPHVLVNLRHDFLKATDHG